MTAHSPDGQRVRNDGTPDTQERVGSLELQVKVAEVAGDVAERWRQRAEVLASWLLNLWRREGQRGWR